MPITKLITIILLSVSALTWFIYDIFVAINKIPGDTISEVILHASRYSLLLPAGLGVILGHLLFPHSYWNINGYIVFTFLGLLGCVWLALDIHYIFNKDTITGIFVWVRQYPIIIFLFHILVGHFIWGQVIVK